MKLGKGKVSQIDDVQLLQTCIIHMWHLIKFFSRAI